MRKMIWTGLAGAFSILSAGSVPAATQFNGQDIFIAGQSPPLPVEWNPAYPELQMNDDGTSGDVTANDGLWSVDVSVAAPGQTFEYKATHGDWSFSVPGSNSWSRTVAGTMKFVLDSTQRNDGYSPDPDGTALMGFIYTEPSPIVASDAVRVTGSFLTELGSAADWIPNDDKGLMNDDGTSGDLTADDGIYTLALTGLPASSYECKIIVDAQSDSDWQRQVSTSGFATGGGNFGFIVVDPADNVVILLDSVKGRVKIENDNPLLNPGPPFYATSPAWSEALGSATRLYDDGTNGDITANDGIHSAGFSAASAGASTVRIRQGVGDSYPAAGDGYPIDISIIGQRILVQFDTNAHADGFTPSQNYMWTDPASRRTTNYVQAVGNFMVAAGGGSDWNNNDPLFKLFDDGTNGDLTADDSVFAGQFPLIVSGVTNADFKALGEQGSWAYQYGGNDNDTGKPAGYTVNGNHKGIVFSAAHNETATFQVDTATGRIGMGSTIPNLPTRNTPANAAASANDWQLFN